MPIRLELLAMTEEELRALNLPRYENWRWFDQAAHARSRIQGEGVAALQSLTQLRQEFLQKHAIKSQNPRRVQGPARVLSVSRSEFKQAGLDLPLVEIDALTPGSVYVALWFELQTPLLTHDDTPFHLFDNPVRKERLFGLPHLSAASVKGLAVDAFQRGFPQEIQAKDEPERQRRYRQQEERAKRLFGITDEGEGSVGEIGRVHFGPVWFERVQYLVMNPMNREKGTGTLPIQFEAIAPGQRSKVEFFYFNPPGSDPEAACRDVAALIAALAAWWPILGLGAKRRAGYGAIRPGEAELQRYGEERRRFPNWEEAVRCLGGKEGTDAPC